MPNQPTHLVMIGGKGPRQRVWEAIRAHGEQKTWTRAEVAKKAKAGDHIAEIYLQGLLAAGYIVIDHLCEDGHGHQRGAIKGTRHYRLAIDAGIESPRVSRDGKEITVNRAIENMWNTMRHFLCEFDSVELAAHASTAQHPVQHDNARRFVAVLHEAGYLAEVKPATRGRKARPARYSLRSEMNTGPRPPIIQRARTVYDQNLGRVMWQDDPDWEDSHG